MPAGFRRHVVDKTLKMVVAVVSLESHWTRLLVWCAWLDLDPAHSAHGFGQQVASLVLWFGLDDCLIDQINIEATRTLTPSPFITTDFWLLAPESASQSRWRPQISDRNIDERNLCWVCYRKVTAVADVLETRISTRAVKGQESQNYLKHDCCRQNENDIPIKDDTVAENWAKN